MADKDKNGADQPRKYEGSRFQIRTPNRGFTRIHTCGVRFVDGNGQTEDAVVAAHCRDVCGYEVTDQQTGKVANPLASKEAAK